MGPGDGARAFTAEDGVEIGYEIFGEPGPAPPVLLHHGFAASTWSNWVAPGIVPALTRAGRWVVAIDARGHGRSGKPVDPDCYGEEKMASDLLHLVDRLGVPSYDLAGYSMGAIVSLLVAARDARVRRLALGGIGAGAVELGGVDQRVLPAASLVRALEAEDLATIAEPMALELRLFADATSADRRALAAHARNVHRSPIAFERILAPTLVVAGEDDALATRPEVLAGAVHDARLERVQGDHMRALLDPRFTEALLEFLCE
jgi:pimeloyl-ACP methyl ester carboxylesterase